MSPRTQNVWQSAALGAVASVLLNNLPAAALLSAHSSAHPYALLIGLDIGPNLAVSGSLAALLWFNAARSVGARPSITQVSAVGALLAPASIAAALAASSLLHVRL